jgi:3-methylfumaryl-CoA hydratase
VPAGAQGLSGRETSALALDDLRSHIGRSQVATDVLLHPGPANSLRLALGQAEPEYREGDPLPAAWLALYFLPGVPTDALRPDGSARDTGVVPAVPLPRRMFAGERVRFHCDLRIGESVRRETRLADITLKSGGTGTLVFATVTSSVLGAGGVAVEEERRTVFRDEVKPGERNQAPRRESAPTDVPWRRPVTPDPVLLFRYSALTFNSHRIHYDRAWAMEVEGYPDDAAHRFRPQSHARAAHRRLYDRGAGAAIRRRAVRAAGTACRGHTLRAVGGYSRAVRSP